MGCDELLLVAFVVKARSTYRLKRDMFLIQLSSQFFVIPLV